MIIFAKVYIFGIFKSAIIYLKVICSKLLNEVYCKDLRLSMDALQHLKSTR